MAIFKPVQYSPIDLVAPAFFALLLLAPLVPPMIYFTVRLINGT